MIKLTRKQIEEGLKTIPMDTLLIGATSTKERRLTASEIKFAQEIALGKTKAEAFRNSRPNGRKTKASPRTASRNGQKLAKKDAIQTQIEAFRVALEAQKYQTPAHLRALAIHKITEKALSEDTPPAQQLKALELLGKITEVALFTERRELIQTTSTEEAKEKLLRSLRLAISSQNAETIEDNEADELLAELSDKGSNDDHEADYDHVLSDSGEQEDDPETPDPSENEILPTPPDPLPQNQAIATASPLHSIPHNGSGANNEPSRPVTPPSVTPVTGENVEKSTPCVSSSSNPMLSKGEGE